MLNKSRSGSAAGLGNLSVSPLRAVVIEKSPIKKEDYPKLPSSAATSPLSSALSSPVFSPVLPPLDFESETDGFRPSRKTSEAGDDLSNKTRISRSKSRACHESISLPPPRTPSRKSPRKASSKKSPYFPKYPSEKVSCIPFPPLSAPSFGLVQESLRHEPFRLLIAVIFLNKTKGSAALPVFSSVMARYPYPASLAAANQADLVQMIQHLGLQNQRAAKCIKLAQAWLDNPPEKGKRHRRLHYPNKDDGKDIKATDGPISDDDPRVAWEVGHLPGIGAYAIDSWRIFCRDELRGLRSLELPPAVAADDVLTPEEGGGGPEGKWTRVLPRDKELRAYLRWMWLRVGWRWNPLTGERVRAGREEVEVGEKGGFVWEGDGVGKGAWCGEVEGAGGVGERRVGKVEGGRMEVEEGVMHGGEDGEDDCLV